MTPASASPGRPLRDDRHARGDRPAGPRRPGPDPRDREEEAAVEVVVGLPRSLSGGEGPAAAKVRAFTAGSPRPWRPGAVRLCDERLSTVTAEAVLRGQGKKGQKRRAVVDQAAAVVILQNALDTERSTGAPPGELVAGGSAVDRGHERVHTGRRRGRRGQIGVSEQLSDLGLELGHEKRHRPRRSLGCLAVLVALAVLIGGGYSAYSYGHDAIKDKLERARGLRGRRAPARCSSRSRTATAASRHRRDAGREGRREVRARRSPTPRARTPSRSASRSASTS